MARTSIIPLCFLKQTREQQQAKERWWVVWVKIWETDTKRFFFSFSSQSHTKTLTWVSNGVNWESLFLLPNQKIHSDIFCLLLIPFAGWQGNEIIIPMLLLCLLGKSRLRCIFIPCTLIRVSFCSLWKLKHSYWDIWSLNWFVCFLGRRREVINDSIFPFMEWQSVYGRFQLSCSDPCYVLFEKDVVLLLNSLFINPVVNIISRIPS